MAADVKIDIAAEFTGKKAFKQAETSTEKLSKNVKKLAGAIGLAYSGRQLLAYGKASIKAAAADEKAQQQLALALKNVGLGRDAAASEDYIQKLQSEFGIVDDKLRPAYQTLAVAVRDSDKAQKLLNLSLDISASTGKDLGAVTAALSRAYLGNNTSLSKLGVGISKADLKAKSFEDITSQLATTFAGSATAAANTFQGSMDKLGVASANVSEIIGTGLIDALKGLGDENSVDNLADAMQDTALYVADVIRGIGLLTEKLKKLPGVSNLRVGMIPIVGSFLEGFQGSGAASRAGSGGGFPQGAPKEFQSGIDARAAKAAADADAKARKLAADQAAKLAAAQKKTLKAQQDALKLAKAKAIFDLGQIQIEAALKGKLSEEDKIRLKLLQAIEEENISNVEKYQKKLEEAQEKTKALQELLDKVKAVEVKNPFSAWTVDPLTTAITGLAGAIDEVRTGMTSTGVAYSTLTDKIASTVIKPNLTEFKSAFKMASDESESAIETAITSLTSITAEATKVSIEASSAATKAAIEASAAATTAANAALTSTSATTTEAIGATTTSATNSTVVAIAESGSATASTIVATSQAAADALDKLYGDSTTALNNATASTTTDFMATSSAALASLKEILSAEATAYAAAATAASAQAAADAADRAGAGTAGAVSITVNTGIGDPNAIAEAIAEVIRDAGNRGTLDVLGID
jgi:hypothetical protein